jgi:hypothetical protein
VSPVYGLDLNSGFFLSSFIKLEYYFLPLGGSHSKTGHPLKTLKTSTHKIMIAVRATIPSLEVCGKLCTIGAQPTGFSTLLGELRACGSLG